MKKIMMTKFGFDRWPEESFSDDGNRFDCYRVGKRVRVSKCVSDGWAYIDGDISSNELPYEIYGKLPHYSAIGKLNGIKTEALTEEMLTQLFFDCIEYEKEYDAALASMTWPTEQEIKAQCEKVYAKRQEELAELGRKFTLSAALKLEEWEWKTVREYIRSMSHHLAERNPGKYPQTIVGKVTSVDFCKPDYHELQDSFYYKWIMERLNK
jgi:hypothetical protein